MAKGPGSTTRPSFWLATESLLPDPLDRALPRGLDHLGGNGYLGITTWLSIALGHPGSVAFRLTNAIFGTFVAVLAALLAERLIGKRAGLAAGLTVALWPTLILWSATMLRDTLCSFIIVVLWWTLVAEGRVRNARVISVAILSVIRGSATVPGGSSGCWDGGLGHLPVARTAILAYGDGRRPGGAGGARRGGVASGAAHRSGRPRARLSPRS